MNLVISRFCCNLLFDPILPVYDFFMNAINRFSEPSKQAVVAPTALQPASSPPFELFLSLERFESYILSTPTDNDASNRKLIMRNQLLLKYFMKDKEQRVELLLDKFQISRQIYSLEENVVIPPTTIAINSTNLESKSSLSVIIHPNLTMALSFQDLTLIQRLVGSFYSSPRKQAPTPPPPSTPVANNNNSSNNEFQIDVEFKDIIIDLVNESPVRHYIK
jgi:hypothetical protein